MANTNISPQPRQQFSVAGVPLAGGLVFTYAAGTANKLATYTDYGGTTPNTNPIVLDAQGSCNLWLPPGTRYKFVLAPSNDTDPPTNPYWTQDNIIAPEDSGLKASLSAPTGSSLVGFSQSASYAAGTIGAHAQQWVSVKDAPYSAKGDGTTDDTAAIQNAITAASGGGIIYFPPGTYKITAALTMYGGVYLVGFSSKVSVIKNFAAAGNTITTQGSVYVSKLGVSRLSIVAATPASITNQVYANNCDSFLVDDCHIHECAGSCVAINNAFFCHVQDSYLDCANVCSGVSLTNGANANTVSETQIYDAGVYGINIVDSHWNTFENVTNEYGKATATLLRIYHGIGNRFDRYLIVDNNNRAQPVVITGAAGSESQATSFTCCGFSNSLGYGVTIDNTYGVTFDACRWIVNVTAGVSVGANSQRVVFIGGYADGNLFVNTGPSDVVTVLSGPGWEDVLRVKDVNIRGHLRISGTAPAVAAGAAAGAGATAVTDGANCTDQSGTIVVTTGGGGVGTGLLATVTFATPFASISRVTLTPGNGVTPGLGIFSFSESATGFDIRCSVAPAITTSYVFHYSVNGV